MNDPIEWITGFAAIVGAMLALYAAFNALKARRAAERASEGLIEVDGKIYNLGRNVDGRLSTLLATTEKLAHAEGKAEGEQAQRDREAQP